MEFVASHGGLTAFIVADDLTGACDAAIPFVRRGMPAEVMLDPAWTSRSEVLAINLASRDISGELARIKVIEALNQLSARRSAFLFKKVDSVFRGNTFMEIKACLSLLPQKFAILAPAYPALGRRIREGRLTVQYHVDHSVIDLAGKLGMHGIQFRNLEIQATSELLAERMANAKEEGTRLILCDTDTEQDLDAIVNAGLREGMDPLWMGSSGLACALAKTQRGSSEAECLPRKAPGSIVFCIGSDHPVSRVQIQHLQCAQHVEKICLEPTNLEDTIRRLRSAENIFVPIDRRQNVLTRHYLLQLCELLQSDGQRGISAFVLSGGDTAALVCDALGVRAIELRNELLPGMPWGTIRGGIADGVSVITKSGGFGSEDALSKVLDMFGRGERDHESIKQQACDRGDCGRPCRGRR